MDSASHSEPKDPGTLAAIAVTLCGVCAFLELYCTQPLLPLLTQLFHASKTQVGMTVSAATLGVALSAPILGSLLERMPRRRVIVASVTGLAIPSLLAATSTSLAQLIFWRFLQGILVPGIIAVVVTYIGEEWPPHRVALIMSFYVSGTALGGFIGRFSAGLLAEWFHWRVSFLAIGVWALLGAVLVTLWLPHGRHSNLRGSGDVGSNGKLAMIYQAQELFRLRRLTATFAVGFNVLFSLVGVFTWITFHLAGAPFHLGTAALSSLFFVYLIGLFVTPAAGYLITKIGLRAGVGGAVACSILGVLLTLAPSLWVVIAGLTLLSSGVFISQTATQSFLRVAAPPGAKVTAAGLYVTCYYLGGTAAGVVPGFFWSLGKWPACVAFIVTMQLIAFSLAMWAWKVQPSASPVETSRLSAESIE